MKVEKENFGKFEESFMVLSFPFNQIAGLIITLQNLLSLLLKMVFQVINVAYWPFVSIYQVKIKALA